MSEDFVKEIIEGFKNKNLSLWYRFKLVVNYHWWARTALERKK